MHLHKQALSGITFELILYKSQMNESGSISFQSQSHSLPNVCSPTPGRGHITAKSADQCSGELLNSRPCVENYEYRRRALCISLFAFAENYSIVGEQRLVENYAVLATRMSILVG